MIDLPTEPKNWSYCGDGVYAYFDGFSIWLNANDHTNPTDQICLEPNVLEAINNFYKEKNER